MVRKDYGKPSCDDHLKLVDELAVRIKEKGKIAQPAFKHDRNRVQYNQEERRQESSGIDRRR